MISSELEFATIEELAALLAAKEVSPVELLQLHLQRIEAFDGRLRAFITVMADSAMDEARAAEQRLLRGRGRGPLDGITIALKDNIWTRGVRTTAGSAILRDFVPQEDATVVRKLRRAGAVLIGKTNMHEFAYGITGQNPHYGAARNPWNVERISGGSSSGSAVATAAGLCTAAIGTDTGGSVRVPAALCGLLGLKPTFGSISRYGIVPLALSFDHVGVLTRGATDAALLLDTLAGYDRGDPDGARQRADLSKLMAPGTRQRARKALRMGRPKEMFWERMDPGVRRIAEAAMEHLVKQGAHVEEISLPETVAAIEPANRMAGAEATAFHENAGYFPERADQYGEDIRARLTAGGELRAVDYLAAEEAIREARAEFAAALEHLDAVVFPTAPVPAPVIGSDSVRIGNSDEPIRGALLRPNRPGNLTGLPAVSMPCGFTAEGLPIGLQLVGRAFDEATLLGIARRYERDHDWRLVHPRLEAAKTPGEE